MVVMDRQIAELSKKLNLVESRVTKLEAEESREAKEGTIRPGTKRGPKPKN